MTLVEDIKKVVEEGKENIKDIEVALRIMERAGEPVSVEKKALQDVQGRIKRIEEALAKEK